jgi:phage terminase large subunit
MEIELNEIFKPLYTSPNRYFFLTGGRASLKSTTVSDFISRLTYESGHGILYTRWTMTSAEKSIIPEFKLTLQRLGIESDFHITKNVITNKRNDSFIYFSGIKTSSGDQTANLKSIAGITTWVVDEGEDFRDEKVFDTIDDSIRTNQTQNRVIWIQNPTTKEHFIYNRWILPKNKKIKVRGYDVTVSDLPEVTHIHSTYHIAKKYLSKEWILKAEKAERENNKWYTHNYIGGWLERAEGVVFENWQEGEFDTSLPYCFGQDYGFSPDPLGLIKVAVDQKKKLVYWKELVYLTGLSTDEIIRLYESSEIKKTDLIVTDTNEPRTTNEIRQRGWNIQDAVKNQVVDDIRALKEYTLIIDPSSYNLKRELNNYAWNDKKASIPIDSWNHLCDPGRYAFNRLIKSNAAARVTFGRYSR